ncbi:MAG: alkyl/aryl-sulfatase [Novosphingobium sp. 17-62-19]|uniref:alkyl/aryl-sulfatase n=1 Tax=Novosphingobium sp. 17-62-19 TaxID=1970406 RepID=UPI000BD1D700|nr:alkyl sulfatase dimerization domain-containing protein [Novosphingobium sp. 17-62-19]OYX93003.1 MAG: alkyl/aryl-sulfatase [Novosphingobium sp. 35-62-5]OZA21738.1 MAG: alkyl/aryl-sulfatase [Novosphingobium sp. 17-62-19]HQS97486.1 alkyl sulfatase dimerization domain-containing protein [Novosphingobium sp.]
MFSKIRKRRLLGSAILLLTALPAVAETPTEATRNANTAALSELPMADRRDFALAERGFVATLKDPVIRDAAGKPVWDTAAFAFAKGDAPPSVHPSLWRHAQVLGKAGLFKVTDHIWQVRGFDVANITFVRGDKGWIVIDPLTATETAAAAYALISEKVAKLPVTAMIYTHSHVDHFGGAGAISAVMVKDAPILAPQGFTRAAVSENVIAGPAMGRRAGYQFGLGLPKGPDGSMGSGIGMGVAAGTRSLVPPTREISETGTELTIDGVRIRFQVTPGTEAPAEMNFGFPDWKVADLAENANATQHNILTPRGAVIRDAKAWAQGLTEAIDFFAGAEVLITSHGWPRFGANEITDYLGKHRDAYAYLHDQTVRLMNKGLTGPEIAATLTLPPALAKQWYDRPYYGSYSFNSRAVYQFYMGWYDGNPVHLAPLPPETGGKRYVEAMGGAVRVKGLAQEAFAKGDYTWAAELLNKVIFADGEDRAAKALIARTYRQLAYQSENALWRNMYLTGADELDDGVAATDPTGGAALVSQLPPSDLFDVLAVRLDPTKAADGALALGFVFPDNQAQHTITVANGVLVHRPGLRDVRQATLTVRYADLLAALFSGQPLANKIASGEAKIEGDPAAFARLIGWLDKPDPAFNIVTP